MQTKRKFFPNSTLRYRWNLNQLCCHWLKSVCFSLTCYAAVELCSSFICWSMQQQTLLGLTHVVFPRRTDNSRPSGVHSPGSSSVGSQLPSLFNHTQLFSLSTPCWAQSSFSVCPLRIPQCTCPPFPPIRRVLTSFASRVYFLGQAFQSLKECFYLLGSICFCSLDFVLCFSSCLLTSLIVPPDSCLFACLLYLLSRLPDYHCLLSKMTHKDLSTILANCLTRRTSWISSNWELWGLGLMKQIITKKNEIMYYLSS